MGFKSKKLPNLLQRILRWFFLGVVWVFGRRSGPNDELDLWEVVRIGGGSSLRRVPRREKIRWVGDGRSCFRERERREVVNGGKIWEIRTKRNH